MVAIVVSSSDPASDPDPGPARDRATPTPATFRLHGEGFAYPSPEPEATTPLGTPPSVPERGSFAFARTQDGGDEPVAWDPCRPIHMVVADATAPDGADELLDEALDTVARATGLRIEVDGPTDEEPTEERAPVQPDRYGDRWAPVLVAWTDPTAVPGLEGDVGGLGGAISVPAPGSASATEVYVTGSLLLDGPQLEESLRVVGGRDQVLSVLLHELGHVIGLGHVEDPSELMHPEGQPGAAGYGPGDRAGLARLGAGACVPDL